MLRPKLICAFVSLSFVVLPCSAEPVWGPASGGLVVALEVKVNESRSTSESIRTVNTSEKLAVVFRNTGTTTISFVVGGSTGIGPMYSFVFTSTRKDGSKCGLLNTTVVGVAGALVPIILRLEPGAVGSVYIDLQKLICTADGNSSADKLLNLGQSIRAHFSGKAEANSWGGVRNGWTGELDSGALAINSSDR